MPKQSAKIDDIDCLGSRTWRRRTRAGDCVLFFLFLFWGGAVVCGVSTSLKEYLAFKIIIIYNIKNHLLVSYLSEAKGKNYPPGMSSLIPRD